MLPLPSKIVLDKKAVASVHWYALFFIVNWVSDDVEFIYMARFFGTGEKSPKIRHEFFQMLNLARVFLSEGVDLQREECFIKENGKYKRRLCIMNITYIWKMHVMNMSFPVSDGISEEESRGTMNCACKYSRQWIFMFFESLSLGHFANFR